MSSQTSGSLLLLSAIGIIIPTAAQRLGTTADEEGAAVLGLLGQGMAQDKVRVRLLAKILPFCVGSTSNA